MLLKAMTFNLRFASEKPPNAWQERRPVLSECLRLSAPDIIGTQEGLYHQLQDIARDRPEYHWIGMGREGGSKGEFAAIFYNSVRFEPIAFDHFWLSDTPELIASKSWGNKYVRMATWVKFHEKETGFEFYFWNAHLDHQVQSAREKAAALMLQKMSAMETSTPLVLAGDFNAPAGDNKAYDILIAGGLADSWLAAKRRVGPEVATFHNYKPVSSGPRIDWILTRGAIETLESEIVIFHANGQYPSDHFPVTATLSLS